MAASITPVPPPSSLQGFFSPRSIALVGVSTESAWTNTVLDGLSGIGFGGEVHLVSRRERRVRGHRTSPSIAALDRPVDLAYLLVPRSEVLEAVLDANASGVRDLVVLAPGYGETGSDGTALERELAETVALADLRMLGPNAQGFVNYHEKVAVFPPLVRHPPVRSGSVAMISQSGGVAAEMLDLFSASGLGLSLLVSTGNEAGINVADVLEHAIDDPATAVICLFLETIRRPRLFLEAARRALMAGKPVVAVKVGRSGAGARSAAAHTGAVVGDDRAVDAALRSVGVMRVDTPEELLAVAGMAVHCGRPVEGGLAALGISGGACSLVGDSAERHDVSLTDFGPDTLAELERLLPDFGQVNNPLDVTGAVISHPRVLATALECIRRDPQVGLVLCQMPLPEQDSPAVTEMLSSTAAAAAPSPTLAPVVVCPGTGIGLSLSATALAARYAIPVLSSSFDSAVSAFGSLAWWARRWERFRDDTVPAATAVVEWVPTQRRKGWSEAVARQFLAANGVPVAPSALAESPSAAVKIADGYGYPAVVKAVSPRLVHKTEVGLVHVGLADPAGVERAFASVAATLAEMGEPPLALVGPMRYGGLELLTGVVRDPSWGLLFVVGLGGVWAEALNDVSARLLPVDRSDIEEMLTDLRGRALFEARPGGHGIDRASLVDTLLGVASLAAALGSELEALELNPLRVDGSQIEALDAMIRWTSDDE